MFNSILDPTEVEAKGGISAPADERPAAAKSTGRKSRKMEKVAEVRLPPPPTPALTYFSTATVPRILTERGCTRAEAFKQAAAEWHQLSEEAKGPLFLLKLIMNKTRLYPLRTHSKFACLRSASKSSAVLPSLC